MHLTLFSMIFSFKPFTVLAPSNAAFNENPDLLKTLFNPRNVAALQELLLYHIVPGFFLTEDLVQGPLQTLLGEEVDVALDPLMFNQAVATETDLLACNGVLDIIDDILIPPGKKSLYDHEVFLMPTLSANINHFCSILPSTDSPVLPEICEVLDFRTEEEFPNLTRIGSVFFHRRELAETGATDLDAIHHDHRKLQFEGERCNPSILDTASENPLLSTFVQLLDAADLEDIFLCAGA